MHAQTRRLFLLLAVAMVIPGALLSGADWPEWRGPARTGVSTETGLPSSWSPSGENLAWRAPYGSRSAPVVFGDRLYLQTSSGANETLQERVICFNADTGKVLWEHRYNLFTSDVPPHRIAWSSPAVDTATGNGVAISGNGLLMTLSRDGTLGHLYAIDATKRGDITTTGQLWHYGEIRRSISTGALSNGILFYSDFSGFLHAVDAKTGNAFWKHDMFAAIWGSPIVIDGKVYLGDEDGDVTILAADKTMKVIAENNMGSSVYSTAVPANGTIFLVNRNELFAIAEGASSTSHGKE